MNIDEIITKIETLREWEALAKEADQMIESLKDELKAYMLAQGIEELEAGQFVMRYKTISSNRFDSTSFKKQYDKLYKEYTKQVISKRFTISD